MPCLRIWLTCSPVACRAEQRVAVVFHSKAMGKGCGDGRGKASWSADGWGGGGVDWSAGLGQGAGYGKMWGTGKKGKGTDWSEHPVEEWQKTAGAARKDRISG